MIYLSIYLPEVLYEYGDGSIYSLGLYVPRYIPGPHILGIIQGEPGHIVQI